MGNETAGERTLSRRRMMLLVVSVHVRLGVVKHWKLSSLTCTYEGFFGQTDRVCGHAGNANGGLSRFRPEKFESTERSTLRIEEGIRLATLITFRSRSSIQGCNISNHLSRQFILHLSHIPTPSVFLLDYIRPRSYFCTLRKHVFSEKAHHLLWPV